MAKIFHIMDEVDERGYGQRGSYEYHDEALLEKAFKQGCEHGYNKAMRELEGYNERGGRIHFKEDFEEKIERLKEKYKQYGSKAAIQDGQI